MNGDKCDLTEEGVCKNETEMPKVEKVSLKDMNEAIKLLDYYRRNEVKIKNIEIYFE